MDSCCSMMPNCNYMMATALCVVVVIVFLIWMLHKKVAKMEAATKNFQKTINDVANLKFMTDDIVKELSKQKVLPSVPDKVTAEEQTKSVEKMENDKKTDSKKTDNNKKIEIVSEESEDDDEDEEVLEE